MTPLIFGGKILTSDERDSIIRNGSIAINGDTIVGVGRSVPILKQLVRARPSGIKTGKDVYDYSKEGNRSSSLILY